MHRVAHRVHPGTVYLERAYCTTRKGGANAAPLRAPLNCRSSSRSSTVQCARRSRCVRPAGKSCARGASMSRSTSRSNPVSPPAPPPSPSPPPRPTFTLTLTPLSPSPSITQIRSRSTSPSLAHGMPRPDSVTQAYRCQCTRQKRPCQSIRQSVKQPGSQPVSQPLAPLPMFSDVCAHRRDRLGALPQVARAAPDGDDCATPLRVKGAPFQPTLELTLHKAAETPCGLAAPLFRTLCQAQRPAAQPSRRALCDLRWHGQRTRLHSVRCLPPPTRTHRSPCTQRASQLPLPIQLASFPHGLYIGTPCRSPATCWFTSAAPPRGAPAGATYR